MFFRTSPLVSVPTSGRHLSGQVSYSESLVDHTQSRWQFETLPFLLILYQTPISSSMSSPNHSSPRPPFPTVFLYTGKGVTDWWSHGVPVSLVPIPSFGSDQGWTRRGRVIDVLTVQGQEGRDMVPPVPWRVSKSTSWRPHQTQHSSVRLDSECVYQDKPSVFFGRVNLYWRGLRTWRTGKWLRLSNKVW